MPREKGFKHAEETKKKMSLSHRGKIFSEKTKLRMSKSRLKLKQERGYINSEETRKKMSEKRKGKTYEEFYGEEKAERVRRKQSGQKHTIESKKRISVFQKKNPNKNLFKKNDSRFTKEWIKKTLIRREKSSLEIKFEEIVNKLNLPYKFVGNGKIMVARKCPDFVDSNGKKIAIEVYYKRHKEIFRKGLEEWKAERIKIFSENGWKIIFLDETQINENTVRSVLGDSNSRRNQRTNL